MDKGEVIDKLKKLNKTNSQIERETGFPKNNLGKWMKTPELFSNRWIEKFVGYLEKLEKERSENFEAAIQSYLSNAENDAFRRKICREVMADLITYNKAITKDQPEKPTEVVLPVSEEGIKVQNLADREITDRIAVLEKELKNPPSNPQIGLSAWKRLRESELNNLKKQLKQ